MLPRVILHNVVSVDGRIDGFMPDLGLYYGLAGRFDEDATLAGSDTILSQPMEPDDDAAVVPAPVPNDERPLLVIPDSRGRVRCWKALRAAPYWRHLIALCTRATPPEHRAHLERVGVEAVELGEDRVDLRRALEYLAERHGVRTVRVDSGGTLNGLLLRAGLVDEVSVLLHPALVGGTSPRSLYRAPDLAGLEGAIAVRLLASETLAGDCVWLRYAIER